MHQREKGIKEKDLSKIEIYYSYKKGTRKY